MGFLKSIGNFVSKAAGVVGKVAGAVGKVTDFLQKPMSAIMEPVKKLAGGVLDKLPFGIGKLVKPFADKFLDKAASFVAGGPLGGLSMLTKAMPTIKQIGDIAQTVGGAAKKVGEMFPQGQANIQNIMAFAQANLLRGQMQ